MFPLVRRTSFRKKAQLQEFAKRKNNNLYKNYNPRET
jgi:hypothetical protein